MIYEAVVSTRNPDGSAHFSPMGYRVVDDLVVLAPFAPSRTLDNIHNEHTAVLNLTDDVSVIAACLTKRSQWRSVAADVIAGWRLAETLSHRELSLVKHEEDATRPRFYFQTETHQNHAPFKGFNRAQAAVLEAAILLTRLDRLAADKVATEVAYLNIAIGKTAGPVELRAWQWVTEAIDDHPKHDLSSCQLR